jgi:hypothetical protein
VSDLERTLLGALDQRIHEVVRAELARPAYVTQRSVETVLGLPRRDYLRLARADAWASTRERRLIVSRTSDVLAYIETRLTIRGAQADNDSPEDVVLARVGARRVG